MMASQRNHFPLGAVVLRVAMETIERRLLEYKSNRPFIFDWTMFPKHHSRSPSDSSLLNLSGLGNPLSMGCVVYYAEASLASLSHGSSVRPTMQHVPGRMRARRKLAGSLQMDQRTDGLRALRRRPKGRANEG